MIDREKVIRGLTICSKPQAKCEDCPYHDLQGEQSCNDALCLDALELLKEQPEIVRCKDCKWNYIHAGCELPHGGDWYCADGERRCC